VRTEAEMRGNEQEWKRPEMGKSVCACVVPPPQKNYKILEKMALKLFVTSIKKIGREFAIMPSIHDWLERTRAVCAWDLSWDSWSVSGVCVHGIYLGVCTWHLFWGCVHGIYFGDVYMASIFGVCTWHLFWGCVHGIYFRCRGRGRPQSRHRSAHRAQAAGPSGRGRACARGSAPLRGARVVSRCRAQSRPPPRAAAPAAPRSSPPAARAGRQSRPGLASAAPAG